MYQRKFDVFSLYFSRYSQAKLSLNILIQGLLISLPAIKDHYRWAQALGMNYRKVPELGIVVYSFMGVILALYLTVGRKRARGHLITESELLVKNPIEFWLDREAEVKKLVKTINKRARDFQKVGNRLIKSAPDVRASHPNELIERLWKFHSIDGNRDLLVAYTTESLRKHLVDILKQHKDIPFGFRLHQDRQFPIRLRKRFNFFTILYSCNLFIVLYHLYDITVIAHESKGTNPLDEEDSMTLMDILSLSEHVLLTLLGVIWFAPILAAQAVNTWDFLDCSNELISDLRHLKNELALEKDTKYYTFELEKLAAENYLKLRIFQIRAQDDFKRFQEYILNANMKGLCFVLALLVYLVCMAQRVGMTFLITNLIAFIFACVAQLGVCCITTHRYVKIIKTVHQVLAASSPGIGLGGLSRTMSPFLSLLYTEYTDEDRLLSLISIRLFNCYRVNYGFAAKFFIFVSLIISIVYRFRFSMVNSLSLLFIIFQINLLKEHQFQRHTKEAILRRKDNIFLCILKLALGSLGLSMLIPFLIPEIFELFILNG